MREILFRGKRVDNGEWITGQLLRYEDGRARIIESKTDCFCFEKDESIIQTVAHSVDPETVGQYTCLSDKNGKKIFDRDVIRWVDWRGIVHENEVCYDKEWCRFCVFVNGSESAGVNVHLSDNIEVIGNIHDNPELLTEVAK